MLIYTNNDAQIQIHGKKPMQNLLHQQDVRLRSFTIKVHKVDAMVSYKGDIDDEI